MAIKITVFLLSFFLLSGSPAFTVLVSQPFQVGSSHRKKQFGLLLPINLVNLPNWSPYVVAILPNWSPYIVAIVPRISLTIPNFVGLLDPIT